jgi:hypothetical protein
MRRICALFAGSVFALLHPGDAAAQSQAYPAVTVPRVVTITGVFQPADGQPPRAVETVMLVLYTDATGGAPLWQEIQSIAVDWERSVRRSGSRKRYGIWVRRAAG